ncbi:alpha/beta fold hydrolase [Salinisphaera aquimarina]|uniref:Alpha/beta fold hydrolase n=1 Tax=Salinisphaera aquimarina TaxID=2094031 RepID=A0ABV7EKV6_9GAMM
MRHLDTLHRQRWQEACGRDRDLAGLAIGADVSFAISCGDTHAVFTFCNGYCQSDSGRQPAFTLVADDSDWETFFLKEPPPAYQSFFGMLMRVSSASIAGDELVMAQHAHLVRRVLDIGRETLAGTCVEPDPVRRSKADLSAGYVEIEIDGESLDIFYESAGHGRDVLLLHTAGAYARQYHGLMAESALTERCRLVAFDLPGHGRSDALPGVAPADYSLTTELYAQIILSVISQLDLDRPVLSGSSMAGEICLEMALRSADRLAGVIACEASDYVPGRTTPWARHPRVNQSLFVPEWINGLMAPHTSAACRQQVWWGYSQGGYATFAGDIDFYTGEWDARERVASIDTAVCPVVMLTGEYDYSCTPEMSKATAKKIPGAVYWTMPKLGHFPMAEHPSVFATHFIRALDLIEVDSE